MTAQTKNKIINPAIDLTAVQCNLFVLFGANRLSYFVTTHQGQATVVCSFLLEEQPLASVVLADEHLNLSFQSVTVSFQNPYLTLVPNLIFNPADAATYLENSFRLPHQHYLLTDNLPSIGSQNVFLAPIEVYQFFQKQYPEAVFHHAATSLLLAYQDRAVQQATPSVFVNVIDGAFQVAVFRQDKLLFWNTFEFKSSKDFIYFVLLVYKQCNLDPENVTLYFSGLILPKSEIHHLLSRYIRTIQFLKRTAAFNFSSEFDTPAEHLHFDLYSYFTL
jgi:hypothetical protein